jgi:alpha-amylase
MQGTKVILGTYNTMPDGASEKVFELTYQRSWRPFLSSLYKFQYISAVLYYSGVVLQWLEEMAGRKQIELLGGGYFNPLFPILQPSDKVGQIEMLTTYLRKTFGKRPSGGWLYEYAWDSGLPVIFRNSGLTYSFLPADTLWDAGVIEGGKYDPVVTEDQRKLLYIFPVFDLDEEFEGPLPFESALERLIQSHPDCRLYTLMVDGHSVPGMWEASGLESPDVMFEKTFAWFQKNCLDVETVLAQNYSRSLRSGKLFYLSSCASQRLEASLDFKLGGASRRFSPSIAKQIVLQHPSSKHLYDKMYHIHSLMTLLRGDKARKKSAQEELWKAQNGEAYWEGCIGGLRRPEVRMNSFKALIEAEKATRVHGSFSPGIVIDDIDCDGEKEVLYQAADLNCYIHGKGASVFELDSFRNKQNYCCVYNRDAASPTNSFIDRIYAHGDFEEELAELESQPYAMSERERSPHKAVFSKEFSVRSGASLLPFFIRKAYLFQKYCVSVDIEVVNRSQHQLSLRYGTELNLQPCAGWGEAEFFAEEGREKERLPVLERNIPFMAEAVYIRTDFGKEGIEIRSDKSFHARIEHSIDKLDTPQILRLHDGHVGPDACAWGSGEVFYQGTKLTFGWDVTLASDSAASFSLSLHL